MTKPSLTTLLCLCLCQPLLAQVQQANNPEPLSVSGSVDTYYKYDFAARPNVMTSFASEQNSLSLGMIDLLLKKSTGKASFVGELSFGPRGTYQSLLPQQPVADGSGAGIGGSSFNIQNLYASYAFTDKLSVTAGFMATFLGYEVISPTGNFNYSTSYLFTNGPFQNAGIKASYAFSDRAGIMVGLFNDWNTYQDLNGISDFGAQLFVSPAKGWNAYLNLITGWPSGTALDLTTVYQVNDKLKLGLNLADYTKANKADGGFTGGALYVQYAVIGLRGEYFAAKDKVAGASFTNVAPGESVLALTVSGNVKTGGLTFIPEVRFDTGSQSVFQRSNGSATRQASQFSLAAVYAF